MDRETIIAELSQFPVATLIEGVGGPSDLPPEIRQMVPGTSCVGTAFTVLCRIGDNQGVTDAVDMAQKGDVLVIDTGNAGVARHAMWGETATFASQLRGLAGIVTNGLIRDIEEMQRMKFPIFAAGVGLRGSTKKHPGQFQVPIVIGDVMIQPGDYIVCGADGVLVIPKDKAEAVIARAKAQRVAEGSRQARLRAGVRLSEVFTPPKAAE